MNKKGFTLIEITAVVLILGTIFLMSFPTLHNILKQNEKDQSDIDDKNIVMAAKTYINLHPSSYTFNEGDTHTVTFTQMIEDDLLEIDDYDESDFVVCTLKDSKEECVINR